MTHVQKKTWKLEKFEAHLTFNTFCSVFAQFIESRLFFFLQKNLGGKFKTPSIALNFPLYCTRWTYYYELPIIL